jgi:hypothetical protein
MGQRSGSTHGGTSTQSARRALFLSVLVGASALFTTAATPPEARADEIPGTGKGIAGGALLGGEIVTIPMAIAGVRPGWAYALGGGLGAVAGGVGGFFIEGGTSSSTTNGQASTYMLAGGMVLIIPALVLTLNATRYHPSEGATEDKPPPGIPPANPGNPSGSPVSAPGDAAPIPATPPTSLFDLGVAATAKTGLRLGVPVPDVRPMYSAAEQKAYGLPQHAELRMPVFRMTF